MKYCGQLYGSIGGQFIPLIHSDDIDELLSCEEMRKIGNLLFKSFIFRWNEVLRCIVASCGTKGISLSYGVWHSVEIKDDGTCCLSDCSFENKEQAMQHCIENYS